MSAMAFDLGADDVVDQGIAARELALRLRILIRRKRQADTLRASVEDGLRLAVIDPLTGIYNRRYAMPRLAGIAAQAAQEGSDFAVMVVDLDRFKEVNDRFGHAAGDPVLSEVARRLSDNLRISDLSGPDRRRGISGRPAANLFADAAAGGRPAVPGDLQKRRSAWPRGNRCMSPPRSGWRWASVGGPCARKRCRDLIDRADQALLASKSAGRNQVTFSQTAA